MNIKRELDIYKLMQNQLKISRGDAQGIYEAAEMIGKVDTSISIQDQVKIILQS